MKTLWFKLKTGDNYTSEPTFVKFEDSRSLHILICEKCGLSPDDAVTFSMTKYGLTIDIDDEFNNSFSVPIFVHCDSFNVMPTLDFFDEIKAYFTPPKMIVYKGLIYRHLE